jgi:hypothetical protein
MIAPRAGDRRAGAWRKALDLPWLSETVGDLWTASHNPLPLTTGLSSYSHRSVKTTLKKGLDRIEGSGSETPSLVEHCNIRGQHASDQLGRSVRPSLPSTPATSPPAPVASGPSDRPGITPYPYPSDACRKLSQRLLECRSRTFRVDSPISGPSRGFEPASSPARQRGPATLPRTGDTIVASQLRIDDWHQAFGDPTLAHAMLGRMVHNAYRLALDGKSVPDADCPELTL